MSSSVRIAGFVVGGLLVVVSLAFFLAEEHGLAPAERPHPLGDVPTAGYAVDGVDNEPFAIALAGVLGVAVTFVVGAGVLLLLRRARPST